MRDAGVLCTCGQPMMVTVHTDTLKCTVCGRVVFPDGLTFTALATLL